MGQDLSHWNIDAMDIMTEAIVSFWFVDVFHFREYWDMTAPARILTYLRTVRFIPDWVPGLRFKFVSPLLCHLNNWLNYPILGSLSEKGTISLRRYGLEPTERAWNFMYVILLSLILMLKESLGS
jgi:hypothetical protein